jgi:CRISPR-associated protein Cas1
MVKSRIQKLVLDAHGSFLGMEKGCFTVRDRDGSVKRFPLFEKEIGEVVLKSGNAVSTSALASFGFWDIDVVVLTQKGRPVAMLRGLDDDSHVQTRICQYEAFKNGKCLEIARQLVVGKIEGQNQILRKYGLKNDTSVKLKLNALRLDNLDSLRKHLLHIEGKFSQFYFEQIFQLIPEGFRPENRRGFKAYDGVNNIFNLAYEVLSWKVHQALIRAKLEPYLGFLHSIAKGKPSLVCDFQELYRYLVDDFVIQYCRGLRKDDFVTKFEEFSKNRKGKREYLNDIQTHDLTSSLNRYFQSKTDIPRMRMGYTQEIETLISEEALLFAQYLRNETRVWKPRVVVV